MTQPQYTAAARTVASPRLHQVDARRPAASPRRGNGRPLSTPAPSQPHHRPITPADAAQARIFERLLHVEISHLRPWEVPVPMRRIQRGSPGQRPPAPPAESSARVAEVGRLLAALRNRFGESAEGRIIAAAVPPATPVRPSRAAV